MTRECDCCDGAEPVDPNRIANRPGKNALSYRIGNQRGEFALPTTKYSFQGPCDLVGSSLHEV